MPAARCAPLSSEGEAVPPASGRLPPPPPHLAGAPGAAALLGVGAVPRGWGGVHTGPAAHVVLVPASGLAAAENGPPGEALAPLCALPSAGSLVAMVLVEGSSRS